MKDNFKIAAHNLQNKLSEISRAAIDHIDLATSRTVNIKDCESVCLVLGPYRNLTTLTASVVFLHPNCQVLNHAGSRIFGRKQIDFLSNFSEKTFDRFIQYAIRISAKGERGPSGGSITYSHAFDSQHAMKQVFSKTDGKILKDTIKCLFWKESLRTSNLIRKNGIDLGRLFEADERLRFILPVRNPLDCARSNLKTIHINLFEGLNSKSSEHEVVQAILKEILWFAQLKRSYPERFFYYFEHDISRNMLVDLAHFLKVEPIETWLDNALYAMKTTSHYEHSESVIAYYRECVTSMFTDFPELQHGLLLFFDKNE